MSKRFDLYELPLSSNDPGKYTSQNPGKKRGRKETRQASDYGHTFKHYVTPSAIPPTCGAVRTLADMSAAERAALEAKYGIKVR